MLKFLSLLRGVRVVILSGLLVVVTYLPMFAQHFTRTDLTVSVSSVSPNALNPDPNLKNSWGLTRSAASAVCGFYSEQFRVPMSSLSSVIEAQANLQQQFEAHKCSPIEADHHR